MKQPKRLYETKHARARRLPIGTWFVYPDPLPRKFKYYQPRIYQALADGKVGPALPYEELAIWELESGANCPQAAYDRCADVVRILNGRKADADTAIAYVKELRRQSVAEASRSLNSMLSAAADRVQKRKDK